MSCVNAFFAILIFFPYQFFLAVVRFCLIQEVIETHSVKLLIQKCSTKVANLNNDKLIVCSLIGSYVSAYNMQLPGNKQRPQKVPCPG